MLNKKLTLIATAVILLIGFSLKAILSNQKEPMKRRPTREQTKSLNLITVHNETVRTQFEISGHLAAYDKADIYAEVSGVLLNTPKRFKAGTHFRKGEILVHIDDAVYRNNVLAQKSSLMNQLTLLLPDLSIDFPESEPHWRAYLGNFDLDKPLAPLPRMENNQERYYIVSRNIFNLYYVVKGMEETLAKYTIPAPFTGVVTQSDINPGTLVRVGQKIGEFTNTGLYELEAAASLQEVQHIEPGDQVKLTCNEIDGEFDGQVKRVNEVIDKKSQTVKVYITCSDSRLRDGMYCVAHVLSRPIASAMRIPRNSIVGNGHVFTVQDSILSLTEVEIIDSNDDQLIVTGLADGTRILGESVAGAVNGMKIKQALKH